MLSPLDDYPVHQIPEPIRHVGTSDRNFYDRYYFNLHGKSDELMLVTGLGQYPNLGVTDAFSHMEWFERPDGSVAVSEVGARPPGAQIASMLGFAYDVDFYSTWAGLMIKGAFTPRERRYAAGTAYLRGMGHGQVRTVHGIDRLQADIGHLVVDSRLPSPGQPASSSYEGEGFITVRHPDTAVVSDALATIVSTVRVELIEGQ